jgi:hypothetical protein
LLHNGTIVFVNTGARTFGITADHVVEQFFEDLRSKQLVQCQMGGITVDLENRIIDRDAALDLATIDVSDVIIGGSCAYSHAAIRWPPEQLRENEVILLGGFPGKLREVQGSTISSPFESFIGRVSNASSQNATLALNFDSLIWSQNLAAKINEDIGGLSGGPVFRLVSESLERIELVGVIYQYLSSAELVLARHLSFVSADGHLVKASA